MKKFEQFAKEIAKKAGEIIKDNFHLEIKREWKEDNSPVTEIDLKVNKFIIDSVKENYPDHSVLGEEESDFSGKGKYIWVCDPIDGTMPFSHGVPIFTFSLALVEDGNPILGVIYDPIMDRMFFAEKGKGAFLNGERIYVSKNKEIKNAVINIDGSGKTIGRKNLNLKIFEKLSVEGVHIFKFISIIYGGALLSAGQFSGTIFLKNTAHDMAAIKIMVEEAGGKVTDIDGNEQRYDKECNGMIASNGLLHDKFIEILKNEK